MIPRECKRLAEVDFPIADVSRHAEQENRIRHRHPKALHLWWARRPLASSRSLLLALLLPDPCDERCPKGFKAKARPLLQGVGCGKGETDAELRSGLLKFIADFANWGLSAMQPYAQAARGLVCAAYDDDPPLVVDPFAGGGSIPLEALRLGCEAFASDLNPVACLILKAMLEDMPRHGPELANQLRKAGDEIKLTAVKELSDVYPDDPDGAKPITYLWARTVRCESPNCGAEIPLMRSFWLCNKHQRKRALRPCVKRTVGQAPRVEFEIFEPSTGKDVRGPTVDRAKAVCLCCESVLRPERVRAQLATQCGGADVVFDQRGRRAGGALLLAVVTLKPGEKGRRYRLAGDQDYKAVRKAQELVNGMLAEWEQSGRREPCPVPDEPISPNEIRRISVPIYGMRTWGDLFTARQKATFVELGRLVRAVSVKDQPASVVSALLGIAVDKTSDLGNSLTPWKPDAECPVHMLARKSIGMAWDFAESVPPGDSSGSFLSACSRSADALESIAGIKSRLGQVQAADAADHPLPDQSADIWFTDPPYYDSVPYAHLADFFFVWLKRTIPHICDSFESEGGTTPKGREIVVDRPHRLSTSTKNAESYELGMAQAFAEGRRVLRDDGIGTVVFAHKTTEGWEALLSGMIQGGWTLTGSWPIATEMDTRLNARENASLATSVHLICRRRRRDAPVGDWADVLGELPNRVGGWMKRLQSEGVRGADLVFACIGPALETYSRYCSVETAEGQPVGLREFLEKVWEVVSTAALRQVLDVDGGEDLTGALEEDARLTALFLWTMQSTEARGDETAPGFGDGSGRRSGYILPYDVVRRFAEPMGIDLDASTGRVINQRKGVVHLMSLAERAKVLFGSDGGSTPAEWSATSGETGQLLLFDDVESEQTRRAGATRESALDLSSRQWTTLDRIHSGMVFQAGGNAGALRSLIDEERRRGPGFLRLANALSALYPSGSQEKRVLDAMLLAVPR